MQLLALAPKDFNIIGRLLAYENPGLANTLYDLYKSNLKPPAEKDLSKIDSFFIKFCREENINPTEHKGAQYKRVKVDKQRLFIAIILLMYVPHHFESVNKNTRIKNGLVKSIAEAINQDRSNVAKMIQEVITTLPVYDEFRGQAERLVTVLIKA